MNGLFQWIRAEVAFCRPKGLAEMMQVAQLVENRDLIRNEASLNGFSGGKYPPQTVSSSKSTWEILCLKTKEILHFLFER